MSRPPRAPSNADQPRLVRGHNDLLNMVNGVGSAIWFPDGTLAAPGAAFANDDNTGFYLISGDNLGIVAGGVLVAQAFVSGGHPQFMLADGTTALPSLAFGSDTNTGIRWISADLAALVAGGVISAQWRTVTGVAQFLLEAGTLALPGLSFSTDSNTGIRSIGSDAASLVAGGADILEWTVNGVIITTAGSSTGVHALQVRANGVDILLVDQDGAIALNGTITANTFPIAKTPVSFAAAGVLALTNAFAGFATPVSVALAIGKWVVQGVFQFTNNGDTGQAGVGQLVTGTATCTISNSAAVAQVPFNTDGDTFMVSRCWNVNVTVAGTVELKVKKTGGAGASFATTQTTIEAWNG